MAYKDGWMVNGRAGEVIGGGFVVMRRSRQTKRVRPAMTPFEYDNLAHAETQAAKLAADQPWYTFQVFGAAAPPISATVSDMPSEAQVITA